MGAARTMAGLKSERFLLTGRYGLCIARRMHATRSSDVSAIAAARSVERLADLG